MEQVEAEFHRTHCDQCFNYKKCLKTKKPESADDGIVSSCPIIFCRLGCNHKFHKCKSEEHLLLCPKAQVKCINQYFGCPYTMERRCLGDHLQICPASVVVCGMEYNRYSSSSSDQLLDLNPNQLDVAAKERDEKTIIDWKNNVPSKLRKTLKNRMTEIPVMPLGVSGHARIPNCILTQALNESANLSFDDENKSASTDTDETSENLSDKPGLSVSVCNKLMKSLTITNQAQEIQDKNVSNSDTDSDEIEKGNKLKKKIELSLQVEIITRYLIKPISIYTFMCAREFRRDEFSNHFQNVHSEIHSQLNGFLYTRCPLKGLGCSFGIERMFPYDENHNVVYNQDLDSWCSRQRQIDQTQDENQDSNFICSLPFEILMLLTNYLDPLSLNSLSLTCTLLREICQNVILKRGIVVFQWEKKVQSNQSDAPESSAGTQDQGKKLSSWEIVSKNWIFSTSFSKITKWSYGNVGIMANHMKNCEFFEKNRNIKTEKFKYPVTIKDL